MQTEEVKIGEKTYVVNEIKYKDVIKLTDIPKEEASKTLIQLSIDMSDEEYDNLSMRDGIKLQKVINKLNGLEEDFQTPLTQ